MKNKDKKKSKIEKLRDLILEEKSKNQEEIIDFYYEDKDSKVKVLVHDKRKIKVALLEIEEHEWMQKSNIKEFECPYNPKTDDPIDEQNDIEDFEYEETDFEKQLEDALQEMVDKMAQNKENSEKVKKIISNSLYELTEKQLVTIFLYYYLDLTEQEIAYYFNVSRQRIHSALNRISKKIFKKKIKWFLIPLI